MPRSAGPPELPVTVCDVLARSPGRSARALARSALHAGVGSTAGQLVVPPSQPDRRAVRTILSESPCRVSGGWIDLDSVTVALRGYGIDATRPHVVRRLEDAGEAALQVGYPVLLDHPVGHGTEPLREVTSRRPWSRNGNGSSGATDRRPSPSPCWPPDPAGALGPRHRPSTTGTRHEPRPVRPTFGAGAPAPPLRGARPRQRARRGGRLRLGPGRAGRSPRRRGRARRPRRRPSRAGRGAPRRHRPSSAPALVTGPHLAIAPAPGVGDDQVRHLRRDTP